MPETTQDKKCHNDSFAQKVQAHLENNCILDYKNIEKIIGHCRGLGMKIVLTQGTWDLVHIGHARYFKEAKKYGDILVIGVDSDEKVKARKGPDRPIVPEGERMDMLTHIKNVDFVVLKNLNDPKWTLIKTIRPDTLIATKQTYSQQQLEDLKELCGQVVVLEPMATTSTSAKVRRLQISIAKKLEEALTPKILETIKNVVEEVKEK